eukprot:257340-Chlamydomonas_euryale.AAC.6
MDGWMDGWMDGRMDGWVISGGIHTLRMPSLTSASSSSERLTYCPWLACSGRCGRPAYPADRYGCRHCKGSSTCEGMLRPGGTRGCRRKLKSQKAW